ncbi:transcription-repair coupling factor [Geoalkalibacter sp.]|uniref:transcription-repair coupling factor n=1 Tax=Geoalkalibacter sp. TaxID=3041440 RepID=UPI00272E67E7|nr:transcription-repair coupling factor [Geoalkalibacter sp.]
MDHTPEATDIAHATAHALSRQLQGGARHVEAHGLTGSAGAWLLAALLRESAQPLFILTADQKSAEQLAGDLAFYWGRPEQIWHFPQWEVSPFEPLSPHPEVEARRIATLLALLEGRARAVVLPVRAAMQRLIPRPILAELSLRLIAEEEYERGALLARLAELGYQAVPLCEDRGTFSVRGDILDLFPPTREEPARVEFFGDFIERMRAYDAASQRTRDEDIAELSVLPARELVLAGRHWDTFARNFKERCDALDIPRPRREQMLETLREGLLPPGSHFLLPFNYPGLETFFDYAGEGRWVLIDPAAVEQEADLFAAETLTGASRAAAKAEPYPPREALYLSAADLENQLRGRPRLDFCSLQLYRLEEDRPRCCFQSFGNGDLRAALRQDGAGLQPLVARLTEWDRLGWKVLLVCHQRGQAERLRDLLADHGLTLPFDPGAGFAAARAGEARILLGELSAGLRLPEERLAVVTEEEVFGPRVRRRGRSEARARAMLSTLAELREGDFIVHADHGIGIYRGLRHLELNQIEGDFLHLEYSGGDKLYLPVDRIEKVQKYVAAEGHAPRLDKMGGQGWEKARLRARAAAEELARELLRIYARREMADAFAFSPPDRLYREFEAAFPYEETPDQQQAIDEVLADMAKERPMDRIVCGDVGYGKTEVAIRAAFKAVEDGKQVALLVPTTVLARQHWQTFRERLADYPMTVEMVSRFRSPAEVREVLERAAAGKVDILIGTHRLIQRDVKFKDLGLLIIDEEQRFGVSHKEKLKKLRAAVDVLTLTATPIPRTLHMSLAGLRDLSVIDTPPVDRLAVRTYVTRFDDDVIRDAILRELRRGGQVFFVHNRVQNIDAMAEFVQTLVPEAKVAVGHGQMSEKQLEEVMIGFIEGKSNVLVCSTIIENGLDIPRANTILINRADCFGLAQLYQLRGRVGRSRHRAYAYLLIPGEATLTREARERLRILQELSDLGAGFRIASHDLELRGAGDLLGANQSGQIAAIGFEMYTELLEETIAELQGQAREEKIDPDIRLGLSAFLPEKYMPDPNQRLVFYKKLAAAEDDETLYAVADELRDRYGELPAPAQLLLEVMKLRVLMKRLRVESAEYTGRHLLLGFQATTPVPPEKILACLQKPGGNYRFTPDYRLSIDLGRMAREEVLDVAKKELQGFCQL